MSTHDDELNRLLDSLARGETDGTFALDADSTTAASRFMHAEGPPGPSAAFVSHLEDSLVKRAVMQPVAVSGRIEHVGEGIGLIAARPMPRRLRFERVAAIAAVAILLLAASNFFRSGSDNGSSWLMAPVASASPVSSPNACQSEDDFYATLAAIANTTLYKLDLVTGVFRYDLAAPGKRLPVLPASFLPTGPSASGDALAGAEAQFRKDIVCWVAGYLSYDITSSVQYDDGRVGLLVRFEFPTGEANWFYVYAPFSSGWAALESIWVWPDEQIAETSTVPVSSAIDIRVWNTTSDIEQTSSMSPAEIRVPSGSEVTFTFNNVGTVVEDIVIPDADVDVALAPGETKTVGATLAPGGHKVLMDGEGDTAPATFGFIYAEETNASTPEAIPESAFTAANCPTTETWWATAEANGLSDLGMRVSAVITANDQKPSGIYLQPEVYFQPAPNDPSTLIEVSALSDIPEGTPPSSDIREEITSQLPFDLFCFAGWGRLDPAPELDIDRMTLLPDGSVGVLLDSDPLGYGTQYYVVYVRGSQQWLLNCLTFVLPDAEFRAPDELKLQTTVLVQGWNSSSNGVEFTSNWPNVVGVPAGLDVIFDVKNIGSGPLTFSITGTNVSVPLAAGEAKDIEVNLTPGTYRFSLSGPSGTSSMEPGFIFAIDAPPVSATPTS